MATQISITARRDAEARMLFTAAPSLAVGAALALVSALERLIAAERDLGGYAGGDPAVAAWTAEADAALTAALGWGDLLQQAPNRGPGDGRLRLVGRIVAEVMRCADATDLTQRMGLVGARRGILHMPMGGPPAAWVNGLIDALLDRVQICVAMAAWPDGSAEAPEPEGTQGAESLDADEGSQVFI